MTHAGADPRNLIGRDADSHARSTDQNAARRFTPLDRLADPLRVIGIVVLRFNFPGAQIDNFVSALGQMSADFLLE